MIDENGYRAAVDADILQRLMFCPATTISLISLANNSRYGYETIRRLSSKGYIKVTPLVLTKDGKQKTTDVATITPAGIRYLVTESKADETRADAIAKTSFLWLRYIAPESTKNISIAPEKGERETVAGIGEAAIIASLAGATVPLFVTDDGTPVTDVGNIKLGIDEMLRLKQSIARRRYTPEQLKFKEMVEKRKRERLNDPRIHNVGNITELNHKAIAEWKADEGEKDVSYYHLRQMLNITDGEILLEYPATSDDYIRFVHPMTVKLNALLMSRDDSHDADRGRYSGLLQSRVRTLLMYPTLRPSFAWSNGLVNSEVSADNKWKSALLPEFKENIEEGTCGTLLFPSAAKFAKIWSSHKKGKRSYTNLGHLFKHLYVTEVSRAGAATLRDIMLTSTDDHYRRELRRVLDKKFGEAMGYYFEKTTEVQHQGTFPVKIKMDDGNWYYCFIGTWFDLKQINFVLKIMDGDKSFGVGVICEPWQNDYYKRIMPEALTFWEAKTLADLDKDSYE